jgi:amyloid beta precursor protein binding protein 1
LEESEPLTLVLYSLPIDANDLTLLQNYSKQKKVPSIAIHSAGFYSYFRIHLPGSFPIVDTHPDSTATTDLRLLTPWPALSEFAAEITRDIDNLSAHEHGHIPYLVLLLYYLSAWKAEYGTLPTTYKRKTEFRKLVSSAARTNTPEGGEENFEEAVAAVLKTVSAPELSQSVKDVFAYHPDTVISPFTKSDSCLLTLLT